MKAAQSNTLAINAQETDLVTLFILPNTEQDIIPTKNAVN